MRTVALCALTLSLAACASAPSNITPTYVNPAEFSELSCEMMADEYETLSANLEETIGRQQANSDADIALTTGGMILLWPLLIGLAFTPDEEDEISLMMGQAEALEASAEAAGCPIVVAEPDVPVVDGEPEVIEREPMLIDGREPRGAFDGTPYEPDTDGE